MFINEFKKKLNIDLYVLFYFQTILHIKSWE